MYVLKRTITDGQDNNFGQVDYYGLRVIENHGRKLYLNWTPFPENAARFRDYEKAVKAAILFAKIDGLKGLKFKVEAVEHPLLASILE